MRVKVYVWILVRLLVLSNEMCCILFCGGPSWRKAGRVRRIRSKEQINAEKIMRQAKRNWRRKMKDRKEIRQKSVMSEWRYNIATWNVNSGPHWQVRYPISVCLLAETCLNCHNIRVILWFSHSTFGEWKSIFCFANRPDKLWSPRSPLANW